MKVFPPLPPTHPLVRDRQLCPVCCKPFNEGARIILVPVHDLKTASGNVAAFPVHANCALIGVMTEYGPIDRIKSGDGSPFPVVIGDKQLKLSEVGFD